MAPVQIVAICPRSLILRLGNVVLWFWCERGYPALRGCAHPVFGANKTPAEATRKQRLHMHVTCRVHAGAVLQKLRHPLRVLGKPGSGDALVELNSKAGARRGLLLECFLN